MRNKSKISRGCFAASQGLFAIGETASGYTLYLSTSALSPDEGRRQWEALESGQDAPSGWVRVSDPIAPGVPATVYDVIPGTLFYLKGCENETVIVTNL